VLSHPKVQSMAMTRPRAANTGYFSLYHLVTTLAWQLTVLPHGGIVAPAVHSIEEVELLLLFSNVVIHVVLEQLLGLPCDGSISS